MPNNLILISITQFFRPDNVKIAGRGRLLDILAKLYYIYLLAISVFLQRKSGVKIAENGYRDGQQQRYFAGAGRGDGAAGGADAVLH